MIRSAEKTNLVQQKLEQISNPTHPLCREDVVWMLEWIKKKVAEKDPLLLDLSQPLLLQRFQAFAEVALMLIQRRPVCDQEVTHLKSWILETAFMGSIT
ncbi:MAG: hypothetical protein JWM44_628 [Bacilli bacterium]|nr:hypothetical protein [Bacilli bacterium]